MCFANLLREVTELNLVPTGIALLRGVIADLGALALERLGLVGEQLDASSPELNAIERVWLYRRERCLSHRLWPSDDDILDPCGAAWNALLAEPGRLRSLCALDWETVSS